MSYLIFNNNNVVSDEGFKPEVLSTIMVEYKDCFIETTTYKYLTYSNPKRIFSGDYIVEKISVIINN